MEEKPKRRWLRFSLRTLLVVMGMTGLWVGYYANWQRQRATAMQRYGAEGGLSTDTEDRPDLPFGLRMLGEQPERYLFLPHSSPPNAMAEMESLFPEAQVRVLND